MADVLSIDFETRSTVDLKATGVYPYAEHPHTDVWCMAWAFNDEAPALWRPGQDLPDRIVQHVHAGGEVRAWNAQFERIMWNWCCVPKYGWPTLTIGQVVDTAVEAATMGLPRSLDGAAKALRVDHQKDDAGYSLMLRLCRPRRVERDGTPVWWDEPAKLEKLYAYCLQDVRVERDIATRLRRQTPMERKLYELDQRMNDRGIALDAALVERATAIALEGVRRANAELAALTGGAVGAVTQNGRMLEYLRAQGLDVDSIDKATVRELLAGDLPEALRRVLTIRAEAGRSSVAKLRAMQECVCRDGRIRGMLFFYGASTGRWSGRLVQPQNFPRGDVADPEQYIPTVLSGDYDLLDLQAPPLAIISSLLRACLVAGEDRALIAADYAAIEARVLNWLAGQDDYVALFASGKDVYKVNAAKLYGIPEDDVQKFPHRQTGKFQELGCGYQMGAKKAVTAAKDVYGLELTPEKAKEIVRGYRETHDKVVQFWYDAEDACKRAMATPGARVPFGAHDRLAAVVSGSYLCVVLPSGRALYYPGPRLVQAETPWSKEAREEAEAWNVRAARLRAGELTDEERADPPPHEWREPKPVPAPEYRDQIEFSAVDAVTKRWGRERTYGGKLVENIVQAVSRDLMAEAMLRVESAEFPPILTVHDEVVAEVTQYDDDAPEEAAALLPQFEQLLAEVPSWAEGCPIAVEGWMGQRYRK